MRVTQFVAPVFLSFFFFISSFVFFLFSPCAFHPIFDWSFHSTLIRLRHDHQRRRRRRHHHLVSSDNLFAEAIFFCCCCLSSFLFCFLFFFPPVIIVPNLGPSQRIESDTNGERKEKEKKNAMTLWAVHRSSRSMETPSSSK